MGTSLEQPRTATAPIVKHTGIGQRIEAIIVNAEQRDQQQKTDGVWKTVVRRDGTGRPAREEVITYLVLAGDAQVGIKDSDDTRDVEPGELVRYIYKGYKWGQRIDAYKNLGDGGGMQVGDHHTMTVVGAVAVNADGIIKGTECTTDADVLKQRSKSRNISWTIELAVRRPKADEDDLVEEAETHHAALARKVREPISVEPGQTYDEDEEPF
jgi:hypothetical protein